VCTCMCMLFMYVCMYVCSGLMYLFFFSLSLFLLLLLFFFNFYFFCLISVREMDGIPLRGVWFGLFLTLLREGKEGEVEARPTKADSGGLSLFSVPALGWIFYGLSVFLWLGRLRRLVVVGGWDTMGSIGRL
jgi:hypothetical protein